MRHLIAALVLSCASAAAASTIAKDCDVTKVTPIASRGQATLLVVRFNCSVDQVTPGERVVVLQLSPPQTFVGRVVAVETRHVPNANVLISIPAVIRAGETYVVAFPELVDADHPGGRNASFETKGSAKIFSTDPRHIFISGLAAVGPQPDIKVTVDDKQVVPAAVRATGGGGLDVVLREPLKDKSEVKITVLSDPVNVRRQLADLFPDTSFDDIASIDQQPQFSVDLPVPSDPDDAALSFSLTATAQRHSKPNLAGTLDTDMSRSHVASVCGTTFFSCTAGPFLAFDAATQDSDSSSKGSAGVRARFVHGVTDRPRWLLAFALDTAAKFEAEKAFANRNGVAELLSSVYLAPRSHFEPRLAAGVEVGKNFGLERKYENLENFSIFRAVAGGFIDWAHQLNFAQFQAVSISVGYTVRRLFSRELDTVRIPQSEQTQGGDTSRVIAHGGTRGAATAAVTLKLAPGVGVEAKFTHGKSPLFYARDNKLVVGLKLTR